MGPSDEFLLYFGCVVVCVSVLFCFCIWLNERIQSMRTKGVRRGLNAYRITFYMSHSCRFILVRDISTQVTAIDSTLLHHCIRMRFMGSIVPFDFESVPLRRLIGYFYYIFHIYLSGFTSFTFG